MITTPQIHRTIKRILELMESLEEEMFKVSAGSQRAAQRARVLTMDLTRLMKEFRKESLRHRKKDDADR